MTSHLDSDRSVGDRRRSLAYHKEFWPAIVAYLLLLPVVLRWGHLDGTSSWRYLWALLPVLPLVWVVAAVVRHLGRIDDYQRLVLLRGVAAGFALAMVGAVAIGFLALAGFRPVFAPWVVFGLGMTGWIVGSALAARQ